MSGEYLTKSAGNTSEAVGFSAHPTCQFVVLRESAPAWATATGLYERAEGGAPRLLWELPTGAWSEDLRGGEQTLVGPDREVVILNMRWDHPDGRSLWLTVFREGRLVADVELGIDWRDSGDGAKVSIRDGQAKVFYVAAVHWIDTRTGERTLHFGERETRLISGCWLLIALALLAVRRSSPEDWCPVEGAILVAAAPIAVALGLWI